MTISAGDHKRRADVGRDILQLRTDIPFPVGDDHLGRDAMGIQPRRHVLHGRQGVGAPVALLDDFDNGDIPGPRQQRQRIEHRPPRFPGVFPCHQHPAQIEMARSRRDDQHRASGLHHDVVRIGEGIGVGIRLGWPGADQEIGGARFIDNVGGGKLQAGAPRERLRPLAQRGAKCGFQFAQTGLDHRPLVGEQLFGIVAFGEIKRRPHVRGRDADHPCLEALRDIARHRKAGVVRLIERKTRHDCPDLHIRLRSRFARAGTFLFMVK